MFTFPDRRKYPLMSNLIKVDPHVLLTRQTTYNSKNLLFVQWIYYNNPHIKGYTIYVSSLVTCSINVYVFSSPFSRNFNPKHESNMKHLYKSLGVVKKDMRAINLTSIILHNIIFFILFTF